MKTTKKLKLHLLFALSLFFLLNLVTFSNLKAQIVTKDKTASEYTYYTLEEIKERFDKYKIDSSTYLSESDFLERIKILQDLKPSTYRTYKAAVAYFATPTRLKEISDINYGINSSIAVARNKIAYMRENKADSTISAFKMQPIERIYDFYRKQFINTQQLEEVKKYVFASSDKPNFEIHQLDKFLPTISQFGIKNGQRAIGYRMSLKDNYHLLIIDLPENGRKIILFQQKGWDNIAKGVY
ncbi:hypothetical protein WAF17_19135 [Bernardetia sp. ABR2-2B]|uniref:hypothetical protein n=1 Tax=Bernardetia sp. ABR2-2B TaxID=3127472 RepID=UPI0030CC5CA6